MSVDYDHVLDRTASCIVCGTRGMRRLTSTLVICPCCNTTLVERGEVQHGIWEEEQAFKRKLMKRRGGGGTSGRKRRKKGINNRFHPFDM